MQKIDEDVSSETPSYDYTTSSETDGNYEPARTCREPSNQGKQDTTLSKFSSERDHQLAQRMENYVSTASPQDFDCDILPADIAIVSIDRNETLSTLPLSLSQQDPKSSQTSPQDSRKLHRKKAYYFSLSQDLRDADGNALITARARVSREV
ncbi:hypothetical protein M3J09_013618 [Ascochyta lentis]